MAGRNRVWTWLTALIFLSGLVVPRLAPLLQAPPCCPIKAALTAQPQKKCCCCAPRGESARMAASGEAPMPCCGLRSAPEQPETAALPVLGLERVAVLPPVLVVEMALPHLAVADTVLPPLLDEDAPRGPPPSPLGSRAPPLS